MARISRLHPFGRTEFGLDVRLVTVQHTGTWFTMGLLDRMGVEYSQAHVKPGSAEHWRAYPRRRGWVLCTLRDPVLAAISSMNRGEVFDVDVWDVVAAWNGTPNTHYFSIDGPSNALALAGLASFLELPEPRTDWVPVNDAEDVLDLKRGYAAGRPVARVVQVMRDLSAKPDLVALFGEHDYSLPWMN